MLRVENLGHRYAGATADALHDVSLDVERGRVLGLLGPNGAGKTTLISHLAGTLALQRGRILVDGEPLAHARQRQPTQIAVAPQDYAFYGALSVAENLACFAAACRLDGAVRQARIDACIDFAQLARCAAVRADRLSGGLKRRLNLAIALLAQPQLLVLDEPTAGVDPQSRAFILEAIAQLARAGAAVIYTSHYMEEIEAIADRVLILDQGRSICEGPLPELLAAEGNVLRLSAPGLDEALLSRHGRVEPPDRAGAWTLHLAAGSTPAGVLSDLEVRGLCVAQIAYGRRDLEQLFMALTHHSLRDGS